MTALHDAKALAFALLLAASGASAQIVVDDTFGSPGALLPDGAGEIEIPESVGRRSGSNLFHSFQSFSIGEDETADFTSEGPGIDRILARVTGADSSLVDGVLRSSISGADLYLFNPHGIVFGPESSLDIGGSFYASTADALEFADGTAYSADAGDAVVLTTAPPSAWGFAATTPGAIAIDRGSLGVQAGEKLALAAGSIDVRGRSELSAATWVSLGADGGAVELVATGGPGSVPLDARAVDAEELAAGGSIELRENALIETTGSGGGRIVTRSSTLGVDGSYALADNTSGAAPPAWALDLQASDSVRCANGSVLRARAGSTGASGGARVRAGSSLSIDDGAHVYTLTSTGGGDGGDVSIEARNVALADGGKISTQTLGAGAGGSLTLESDSLEIRGTGSLVAAVTQPGTAATDGYGPGGDLTVEAGEITIEDGGQILSRTTGGGDAGAIHVEANRIQIDGVGASDTVSGILSNEEPGNRPVGGHHGRAGDLTIEASRLEVSDGGVVQLRSFIEDDAPRDATPLPHLRVEVDEIELSGNRLNADSGIYTQGIDRDAASAEIIAERLRILPGAVVTTTTRGAGRGGDLRIQADEISIEGSRDESFRSGLFSSTLSTESDAGNGGNLSIFTRDLEVRERGDISVATRGDGDAGSLTINRPSDDPLYREDWARNARIRLDGGRILSRVEFDFPVARSGGDIEIHAGTLELEDGGRISALNQAIGAAGNIAIHLTDALTSYRGEINSGNVEGPGGDIMIEAGRSITLTESAIETSVNETIGDGGNVDLRSDVVVINRSNIEARAVFGHGGNIRIESGSFVMSADSTLDATSSLGIDGDIIIRSLEESLPQNLAQLPKRFLEEEDALHRTCAARSAKGGSLTVDPGVLRIGPDGPIDADRGASLESHGCPPIR